MSGKDALIRAASKNDGTEKSTLNVSGIVNVLKDAVGIIASRETNVEQGGSVVVADNATLNLIRDMNRGAAADEEPTGDNAKFNVAGSLVNNGIINAEKQISRFQALHWPKPEMMKAMTHKRLAAAMSPTAAP